MREKTFSFKNFMTTLLSFILLGMASTHLDTWFLRGSWLSSVNLHKEFDIVAISLFYDEDIGQGGL